MACPLIYAPVCLENGQTAGNECAASCANSTIKCQGECPCPLGVPPGTSQPKPMNGTTGPVTATPDDVEFMAPYQCMAPAKPGPCRAFFQRYFYNTTAEECQPFVYGGCQGNTNNFESLEECNQVCVAPRTLLMMVMMRAHHIIVLGCQFNDHNTPPRPRMAMPTSMCGSAWMSNPAQVCQ